MDYEDLLHPDADNPSGTKLVIYFAPERDFLALKAPVLEADAADIKDTSVITEDHTFNVDYKFNKLELEVNMNELTSEIQGAVAGGADKFSFEAFHSNISPTQAGTFRKIRRDKHIVLIPLPDGQVIQLGSANNGATIAPSTKTGKQEGGDRGTALTITSYGYLTFYEGTIALVAAV